MTTSDIPPSPQTATPGVPQQRIDDEPMQLITSFNDVFVVVASALLVFGTVWLTNTLPPWLIALICAALFWGLSEVFVRRRRMALPALSYSFGFIATLACAGFVAIPSGHADSGPSDVYIEAQGLLYFLPQMLASYVGIVIGTVAYWRRFRVPATIALGFAGVVCLTWFLVLVAGQDYIGLMRAANIVVGLAIFVWALRWDAQDPQRKTIRSDVAFWLHLLAACMVTHPIFWALMPGYPIAVIAVFVLLTGISLAIDRRALMMSSLLYVISAILSVLVTSAASQALAVVAVVVGGALLLLSALWRPARAVVLKLLPSGWRAHLPQ
ncbi:hypothetical protein PI93_002855 [Pandoraea fibrosis]|uniref:Uncharacterized protein n=1 Tax=Pandoraea fibrosis TaxID=1891094 RepID=A0ABX6HLE3_9BURK|nr:hypothetical protein [Pandoraea fibrosis]QHE90877.1 hypothetical protein PJ20_002855 [Pandoraea fibrosis]QHF11708.1 hypothetical protein PI93_002855 [Pandoraea fibrosis]